MRIAVIDDQLIEARLLTKHIDKYVEDEGLEKIQVEHFTSGDEFLKAIAEDVRYDIIFLDIYMDGMNGVDTARAIRQKDDEVPLVFCTSSNEYAMESYEVGAVFYLLKPYNHDQVVTMMKRVTPAVRTSLQTLTLPDGQVVIPRDIVSTEHYNHKITLHMNLAEDVSFRTTQGELEEMFADLDYLCVVNRGYIVNLYHVKKMEDNEFIMRDGTRIPISRGKKAEVKKIYEDFVFNRVRNEILT